MQFNLTKIRFQKASVIGKVSSLQASTHKAWYSVCLKVKGNVLEHRGSRMQNTDMQR